MSSRRGGRVLGTTLVLGALALGLCVGCAREEGEGVRVVASTSVLADICRNVAGRWARVTSLIPAAADPHGFQPTPGDLRSVAASDLIVLNGAGLEGALRDAMENAGLDAMVVEAARGLPARTPGPDEVSFGEGADADPHYWLDPLLVVHYVRVIETALKTVDPAHAVAYAANADRYVARLEELDRWIGETVAVVPERRRLLVTDHLAWGYFADRYGFRLIGAVMPSVTSGGSPTARDLSDLVARIRELGVPVIFVDAAESPTLAKQVAAEAGVRVVDTLRFHSLTGPKGPASTYLTMMRFDVEQMVEALR
jgi:ABC-type Zn uptake system ZnuABC Zn-binding protein ZnuA